MAKKNKSERPAVNVGEAIEIIKNVASKAGPVETFGRTLIEALKAEKDLSPGIKMASEIFAKYLDELRDAMYADNAE